MCAVTERRRALAWRVVTEWRAPGTGTADSFAPSQLAPDRAGNMLVADESGGAIWVVSAVKVALP